MLAVQKHIILDLLQHYKNNFLKVPLSDDGTDELYKWQLITDCHEKTDVEIIRNFKPINVVDVPRVNPVLSALLNSNQQQLIDCFNWLKDENFSLSERLSHFKQAMNGLCGDRFKAKANDERTASAFLACWNPKKYTFYKDEIYQNYCSYIGEQSHATGEKYPHYLQLIAELAETIKKDPELNDKFQNETNGLIQSDLLTAQNVLWQMKDMMNIKEDKYINFKHLLEYFVSHLEWCNNSDTSFIGYNQYIKPLLNAKKFKYAGQGWNGGQIQEQIEPWAHYEEYTICINIYGANYQSNACYLNWEGTWINVRPLWDNDHIVKLYLSKEEKSSAKEERIKTIQELSLFDNKEPNQSIKAFFDEYEKMILEYDGTYYNRYKMEQLKTLTQILNLKKNIILQGAPGTGKTYNTAALALSICGVTDVDLTDHDAVMKCYEQMRFDKDKNPFGQIGFCTFHQSMDYEDFVEGIKPKTVNEQVAYEIEPGIFKTMCENAKKSDAGNNYVLIIDEINRGKVSKIFGELITLLEADKRIGGDHPIKVTLPYSKESFGVPSNLYIIGTMNTTDRSVGNIDYAVRRRFAFVTLESKKEVIEEHYKNDEILKNKALALFEAIESFLKKHKFEMDFADLMVGHSYFLAKNEEDLELKWRYEIVPLLHEYYKDGIIKQDVKTDTTIEDFCISK